jgi:hypothetical protein
MEKQKIEEAAENLKRKLFNTELIHLDNHGGSVFHTQEVMRYINGIEDLISNLSQPPEHKGLEELKAEIEKILYTDVANLQDEEYVEQVEGAMESIMELISLHLSPQSKPVVDTKELRKKFTDTFITEFTTNEIKSRMNLAFDWFIENLQPQNNTNDAVNKFNCNCMQSTFHNINGALICSSCNKPLANLPLGY